MPTVTGPIHEAIEVTGPAGQPATSVHDEFMALYPEGTGFDPLQATQVYPFLAKHMGIMLPRAGQDGSLRAAEENLQFDYGGHLVRTKPSTMMAGRWMARGAHRARVGPAAGLALLLRRCRACCRESTSMDLPLPLVARRPHGDQCSNTARSSSGLVSIQTHCADFHTDL